MPKGTLVDRGPAKNLAALTGCDAGTTRTEVPARTELARREASRAVVVFRKPYPFCRLSNVGDELRNVLARDVRKHDP